MAFQCLFRSVRFNFQFTFLKVSYASWTDWIPLVLWEKGSKRMKLNKKDGFELQSNINLNENALRMEKADLNEISVIDWNLICCFLLYVYQHFYLFFPFFIGFEFELFESMECFYPLIFHILHIYKTVSECIILFTF